jgi:hypothetical protein
MWEARGRIRSPYLKGKLDLTGTEMLASNPGLLEISKA